MAQVFISYSRRDKVFTQKLFNALEAANREVWADWDSIPAASDWDAEIKEGIEKTECVLFVLSPEWLKSNECRKEMNHAVLMGKRLLPILYIMVDPKDVPPELAKINWVYMRDTDDFDQGFQTLCGAMDTDLDWVKTHTRIQVRAVEWDKKSRDPSFALRGKDLADGEQFLAGAANKSPVPTPLQSEYILASRKDANRRQRVTLAGVTTALIVSIVLGIVAFLQKQEAVKQSHVSRAGELAALAILDQDKHFDLSLLFGVEAFNSFENLRTRGLLLTLTDSHPMLKNFLFGHTDKVSSIAFSPNGRYIASGSFDHTIILWDVSNPKGPTRLSTLKSHSDSVTSVAFSPNGKQLASGSTDQTIILWDISNPATPSRLATFSGMRAGVAQLAYSQDGKHLISVDGRSNVILWDVTNTAAPAQRSITPGQGENFFHVDLSPNGKQFAVTSGDIVLWDISDPLAPAKVATVPAGAFAPSVAFSPDGKQLAMGGIKASLTLWDISTPESPNKLTTFPEGDIEDPWAVFSPDGTRLASISKNGTITLWDISNPTSPWKLATLSGHTHQVWTLAFSPDGKQLVSGSEDAAIILWDADPAPLSHLTTFSSQKSGPVMSLAFSPDGKQLASGSGVSSILLWDIQNPLTPAQIGTLPIQSDVVYGLAFSSDGKRLVSANDNNFIQWDLSHPSAPTPTVTIPFARKDYVSGTFSADGHRMALRSQELTTVLWDIQDSATPSQLGTLPEASKLFSTLALSSDGKWLASVSSDRDDSIILWDISNLSTPLQLATLSGHTGGIESLAFSHDDKILASGSDDNSIILWDLSNPAAPVQLARLSGPANWPSQFPAFMSVAFSADDKQLASGSYDGSITLWDLNIESWLRKACQRAGRNFTAAEWALYFPTEDYPTTAEEATCPQWPFIPYTTPAP